ncbi:Mu transposase C-terminal domain-containing protein [Nonomuraea antri]|uniref:Mu transposase C-terminal domain-containing protein n=1 Tax=Nonomuraea antri TaxID=2730852 RepID=UPI001C2BCED5|nr:Mu transposase C-terminal domain-containing protein [Nonomuraea antri]
MLTMEDLEHVVATWIVSVWQRRALGEYAPAWDPDGTHSSNTLFAASFAQTGFAMQIPSPELFYELLPVHHITRISRRGVKIRGLWYDGGALEEYRGATSIWGGRHKGQWVIRRDPRDRRRVFFQDPITHAWHTLGWSGLPPVGQMPAFGDARVRDLLKKAAACGLKPKSDAELLPVLLELIGSKIPVSQWPTQMTKTQRTDHAREIAQADAAQTDRPAQNPPGDGTGPAASTAGDRSNLTALRWPQRAQQTIDSIDAERRRRREAAVPVTPKPPPPLGSSFRERNVFILPDDDEEDRGPAEHG